MQANQTMIQTGTHKTMRAHNFSAGPAVMPLLVLEQIQAELLNYAGHGMSVMEMSHRSAQFEDILQRVEADLRTLLNIPEAYSILFLQGGAHLQFTMLPTNLLPAGASWSVSRRFTSSKWKPGMAVGCAVSARSHPSSATG